MLQEVYKDLLLSPELLILLLSDSKKNFQSAITMQQSLTYGSPPM